MKTILVVSAFLLCAQSHLFGETSAKEMYRALRSARPTASSPREIGPIDFKGGLLGFTDCRITSSSAIVSYHGRNTRCVVYSLSAAFRDRPFAARSDGIEEGHYIIPIVEFYSADWRRARAEVGEKFDFEEGSMPRLRGWIPSTAAYMVVYADVSLGDSAAAPDGKPILPEGSVSFAPKIVAADVFGK